MARSSRLSKVVIDVPPADHDRELAFWNAAVGEPLTQGARFPEYHGAMLPGQGSRPAHPAARRAQRQQRAALGLMIDVEPGRFEDMVVTALDGLPEDLGRLMRNVAVIVEHDPGPPGLLGLYEGIPLTSRTSDYAGVLPDRITIYRRAICAICRTEQEVANQVRRTVVHEIAHHFGIDDDRLTELGW